MSIFDRFPWTNFHELNLDEIIRYAEDAKKSAAEAAQTAEKRTGRGCPSAAQGDQG